MHLTDFPLPFEVLPDSTGVASSGAEKDPPKYLLVLFKDKEADKYVVLKDKNKG